jgi:hypothetical protein
VFVAALGFLAPIRPLEDHASLDSMMRLAIEVTGRVRRAQSLARDARDQMTTVDAVSIFGGMQYQS